MGSHDPAQEGLSPKRFHIFGNGISFSISPTIHNAGFQYDGLPYYYSILESPGMDGVASVIKDQTFGGASVTMPHKLQAHKYCDKQSETARTIGAINTLIVEGEGSNRIVTGDNTDWSGLCAIMTKHGRRTGRQLTSGLVVGAGGASRAALYALHCAGVGKIYLWNRTLATAEAVRDSYASLFPIEILPSLKEAPPQPVDVVVGTIPADTCTIEQFDGIFGAARGLCIDMTYKPRRTPLLAAAGTHQGWDTITGVEVLLAQAFDQYKLWTGRDAPTQIIVDAVNAHEAARGNDAPEVNIDGKL